ncbi:hypothetical protein [Clostridium senegalense]|uniref:hypothetical protein n=1 Tax=Clostridium senegalense TaxID=1465809 RepID=UPI000289D79D|nr:hypothetical protein [Clostridium senegalense]MBU5226173.1 hypothetical protein [Clostridium senegalense]
MNRIKSISGPNKEEVWEWVSDKINGKITVSANKGRKIEAKYKKWPIVMEYYTMMAGNIPISYTRVRATFTNIDGFKFKITNRNNLNTIGEDLDMKKFTELDKELIEQFIIMTNNVQGIKPILENKYIMDTLSSYNKFVLEIKELDDCGKSLGEYSNEIVFRTSGIIKNGEQLKQLYNTVCKTLDNLA